MTIETVVIKTQGDTLQDVPLANVGGKGLFVKEIEDALLRDEVDIAVHSMKDVPMELPNGLEIGVMSEREDPHDVLISKDQRKLADMPVGDGIIVAAAGLKRMGWADRITEVIPAEIMLPAVGQGALGIELRKNDAAVRRAVSFLNHPRTWVEVSAERAFLRRVGGGCQLLGSLDGRELIKDEVRGVSADAEVLGTSLAERILSNGGQAIMDEVYRKGLFCGEER